VSPGTALITGVSGQDGSYLAELLLADGWRVAGLVRPGEETLGVVGHLAGDIEFVRGDLLDRASLRDAVLTRSPERIFHLAAPSFVPDSWLRPAEYVAAIAGSCAELLAVVAEELPATRLVVASSGAMFGDAPESPQREDTPFRPTNPYAVAKLAAHHLVGAMRSGRGLHASSAILYNHESERRPEQFVSRRVSRGAAAISLGAAESLSLGSLEAVRDWSHARDMMRGLVLMADAPEPDDYVLASGVGHTVGELATIAFASVGLDSRDYVVVDDALRRPPEATPSVGDPDRARRKLGWRPEISFEQLVEGMVRHDVRELQEAVGRPAAT
jgi:GDPmannose 4,6-dehydratase